MVGQSEEENQSFREVGEYEEEVNDNFGPLEGSQEVENLDLSWTGVVFR